MNGPRRRRALGAAALAGVAWWALRRAREADLAGQLVLITGGSRGLGLLLAREFAGLGCRLAICARDAVELERARAELAAAGAEVLAVPCDVSDAAQVEAMVREVERRCGGVDVLVNNAGIIQVGPLQTMDVDDFRRAMAVNFFGAVHATLAALPGMRARGAGRIVNVCSIGGKVAIPHLLPYDAAKFALTGFSQGLRAELAGTGITVTTIIPGLMRTGSPVNAFFKGQAEKEFAWFSLGSATPLSAMHAGRAARRIVQAARRGEAEVTLTWQAKALRIAHDLFPGAMSDVLGGVARLLPGPGAGGGTERVRGMELATPVSPSPVTGLMNRAARRNNEFGGVPQPSPEHARRVGLDPPDDTEPMSGG
ncbi:MAG: SDR family NAD(P)-dependent oxidoreductase [Gemmatimonadetes bacterium]|nr:SDR family NAD(P)-dependent oxidoreductase [Gemmatimonadota bacterium]